MRRTERERTEARREAFAAWFRSRLVELDYDLSAPRGGGIGKFAADVGISHTIVSHTLAAKRIPSPEVLADMAPVLRVPLPELLVRAGILTEEELPTRQGAPEGGSPPTPEQLAKLAGIHDPQLVQHFVTFVAGLRAQQAQNQQERGN
ncbi:XRE family transcriptional regulator [Streptomyces sp. NPDC059008]|uniref:XRE family transcriptional regulator n=1 Tax=Streptomyces sp. NPDC059008 TaxID=3346693 RepID=UPI0036B6E0BD